jgi:hypothetical protein
MHCISLQTYPVILSSSHGIIRILVLSPRAGSENLNSGISGVSA